MLKQARLAAILKSIDEYKEKEEQATYGAKISLQSREFEHLKRCSEILILVDHLILELNEEAKDLQIEIDKEAMDVL